MGTNTRTKATNARGEGSMIGISLLVWTIFVYMAMRKLYARFYFPLLVPIATSTVVMIVTLSIFRVSYEQYMTWRKMARSFARSCSRRFSFAALPTSPYVKTVFMAVVMQYIFWHNDRDGKRPITGSPFSFTETGRSFDHSEISYIACSNGYCEVD